MNIAVCPSKESRKLYNQMSFKSDDLILDLDGTVEIAISRSQQGLDPEAPELVTELITSGWIKPHTDGGWDLDMRSQ